MRSNENSASGDSFGLRPEKGPWAGVKNSLARFGSVLGRSQAAARPLAGSAIQAQILDLLIRKRLFERLDDRLCPADSAHARAWCQGGLELTVRLLAESGVDADLMNAVLRELVARDCTCDCGVLYKLAGESRLKTEYWLARALSEEPFDPHSQFCQK